MKRPRPHIPLNVRVKVAERQCREAPNLNWGFYLSVAWIKGQYADRLKMILRILASHMGAEPSELALDHDPALILRPFNEATGKYTPDANDPDHLVYRTKEDHLRKTVGRTVGAAKTVTTKGSDIWLKKKFDRLEGRAKRRPKAKIPQRKNPWPKRKFGK